MNICLVIISSGWAGAETVVHELARHLRGRDETVCVLLNQEIFKHYTDLENVKLLNAGSFFRSAELLEACVSPQIKQEAHDKSPDSYLGSFYLNAFLREIYFRRVRSRLAQSMTERKFDVIHTNLNAGSILISNIQDTLSVPVIATLHGQSVADMHKSSALEWLSSPVASFRRERLKRALGRATKITAVSHAELDTVEACEIPVKAKATVIPNGINISEIQSSATSVVPLKGSFNLLFAGGAMSYKGGDLLIRALLEVTKQIEGVHLYMGGDVPRNHSLRKMVTGTGIDTYVTFTGFLEIREYRELLSSVDVLVMPSREESFGIALLEAMALGKPVIGTNVGGIPEVVKNERNGILVEPNPAGIAKAITYLYENKQLRQEMGRNNLQDVARFDWNSVVGQYIDLYRSVIKNQ